MLQTILQMSPNAIIMTGDDGAIKSFNDCAESLFGYRQCEVLGKNICILFGSEFVQLDMGINRQRSERCEWRNVGEDGFVQAIRKSGEVFPVEVMQAAYKLEASLVHIYYIKDASVFHRQQQRIAELERENAHLSRNSMLGELASAITHELSQPLTAIANYTAAASRYWGQSTCANMEGGLELLSKAGEQAKRAWLIMHRLRKLLQHRGAERVDEDLRLTLEDAIELATLGASQHSISISIDVPDEPVIVRIDRIQVQILLTNLIRNAVDELRVSPGDRKIWIKLTVNDDGVAEVRVEDTGPGIAPEVYENIFDPFLTTKPEGLGVGLAVSRRIAQAHGGWLAAKNRAEGGAAFSFLLPVSK